ncbi:unnamed protein product [Phytophthora fragariaefolia]|uniref:Unnamed protein product n=1 Tax=Phytophthora fragariaefolia TaxID=1490495 RepID=A0A9W7D8A5_9STRA|nr:unnamed protein product [Phytophthora fragariaefolia]
MNDVSIMEFGRYWQKRKALKGYDSKSHSIHHQSTEVVVTGFSLRECDAQGHSAMSPNSVVDQRISVASGGQTTVTMPVSAQRLCTRPGVGVTIRGIATGKQKPKATSRRGGPAGGAVQRVNIGHAFVDELIVPAEAAEGAAASDLSVRTLTTAGVVREKCEPNQKTQIQSDLRGSRSVKGDGVVSTVVDTQVEQEKSVTEGSDLGASAPGSDAIGPNINGRSAVRHLGKRGASAPGADAASSAGGCKRPAPEMLADREFDEQSWDSLKSCPLNETLCEYKDVLLEAIPAELPQDKGVKHEIDLVPETRYCVTRQWSLPREQAKAIDDFFESRRKARQVRESKSPHSAPTFCVKKAQGG